MKKPISKELEVQIKQLYDDNVAKGVLPRNILPKINNMLKASGHGGYASEKSLYNLVNSFGSITEAKILDVSKSTAVQLDKQVDKKIKNAINFDLDLAWQNEMTKDIAARLYKRFIAIDEKGDKANQRDLIEFAKITKEFIDQGVKIDALNAKKIGDTNDNKTQLGIALYLNGSAGKRLEEVSASVIEGGFVTPQAPAQLSEASYD